MTTVEIFRNHNIKIMNNKIPLGNEPLETYYTIDPNDEIFDMPLSDIKLSETTINTDKKNTEMLFFKSLKYK